MSKKFSELKRREVRVELADGIKVFNPTPEQKRDILTILTRNAKGSEINISGEDILLELIPMLTNVKLDLDREKNKDEIAKILDDPDELLEDIVREVKQIVRKISKNAVEILNDLKEVPKEQRDKMIEKFVEKQDPKQKQIEDLERQLKQLKNED